MEFKLSVECTYILDITYHNISNKPLIIYLHTICNVLHSITSIYLCLKCLISYSMQSTLRTQYLNGNNFIIYKLQISLHLSTFIGLLYKMCSLFFFGLGYKVIFDETSTNISNTIANIFNWNILIKLSWTKIYLFIFNTSVLDYLSWNWL